MNAHALISLPLLYRFCGVLLAVLAVRTAGDATHPKRWGSAVFWAVLAVVFLAGEYLPPVTVGYALVVLVLLAATGRVGYRRNHTAASASSPVNPAASGQPVGREPDPRAEADRLRNRIFYPALLVPAIAVVGSRVIGRVHVGSFWLGDPEQATLAALGLGAIVGLVVGVRTIQASATTPFREGSRLVELLGWSLVLPQLLAALGGVFQRCGVGTVVADALARVLPSHSQFVAVAAYCMGMAVFTICVGNAFAAFAVVTGGIGLPLIVQEHHGNPAIMAALGMLSGYCGTLVTPMAANFNLVPVLLLELPDQNAVIKAQAPIAAVLLLANIVLMYVCVYRF